MACEYCEEGKPLLCTYAELFITSNNDLEIDQFSSLDGHFIVKDHLSISYCPMCGERLGDTNE